MINHSYNRDPFARPENELTNEELEKKSNSNIRNLNIDQRKVFNVVQK